MTVIWEQRKILRSGTLEQIKDEFNPRQTILLEVPNWDDNWKSSFDYPDLVIDRNSDLVTFSTTEKTDIRAELCRTLINSGADLLSLKKEKAHVEDIFRSLTEGAEWII